MKFALAAFVVLTPALAAAQDCKAVGWTRDSTAFVVAKGDVSGDGLGGYVMFDPRIGVAGDLVVPGDYETWKQKHPLALLGGGAKSADGKRELLATSGTWKDGRLVIATSKRLEVLLSVKSGGKNWPAHELVVDSQREVEAVFAPDGRRVAIVIHGASARDEAEIIFAPTSGPRIELLAQSGVPERTFPEAAAKLEAAGLVPVASDESAAAHPDTVVYAARGFEAEAKKAATALGGTVEPMVGKPGFELVVAIGAR